MLRRGDGVGENSNGAKTFEFRTFLRRTANEIRLPAGATNFPATAPVSRARHYSRALITPVIIRRAEASRNPSPLPSLSTKRRCLATLYRTGISNGKKKNAPRCWCRFGGDGEITRTGVIVPVPSNETILSYSTMLENRTVSIAVRDRGIDSGATLKYTPPLFRGRVRPYENQTEFATN